MVAAVVFRLPSEFRDKLQKFSIISVSFVVCYVINHCIENCSFLLGTVEVRNSFMYVEN